MAGPLEWVRQVDERSRRAVLVERGILEQEEAGLVGAAATALQAGFARTGHPTAPMFGGFPKQLDALAAQLDASPLLQIATFVARRVGQGARSSVSA
jgi:hypothetical protein